MRGWMITLSLIFISVPTGSRADPASDASAIAEFPQLRPRNVLPPILAELKRQLFDPHSITDFVLCPASRIGLAKTGERRPVHWEVMMSFNAKNREGGYIGTTMYGATFKEGKRPFISKDQMDNDQGLNHFINKAIAAKMANCPSVPDQEIQRLLAVSDRPTVDLEH